MAAGLCAYVDPERQNRDLLPLVDRQCDHAALPDGGKQVVQDLAVQGIQDIVVLETELLKPLRHAVPEKGADHAKRCSFLKKSRCGVPGSEICTVLAAPVDGLPSFFPQLNKAQRRILSELFSDRGFIRHRVIFKIRQPLRQLIHQTCDGQAFPAFRTVQDIQKVKVQHDVPVREAPGPKGPVKGIILDRPAVDRQKDTAAALILPEGHVAAQPALDAPPLIVVASGALCRIFIPVTESVHVEGAQISADPAEIFDQFTVGHVFSNRVRHCAIIRLQLFYRFA